MNPDERFAWYCKLHETAFKTNQAIEIAQSAIQENADDLNLVMGLRMYVEQLRQNKSTVEAARDTVLAESMDDDWFRRDRTCGQLAPLEGLSSLGVAAPLWALYIISAGGIAFYFAAQGVREVVNAAPQIDLKSQFIKSANDRNSECMRAAATEGARRACRAAYVEELKAATGVLTSKPANWDIGGNIVTAMTVGLIGVAALLYLQRD